MIKEKWWSLQPASWEATFHESSLFSTSLKGRSLFWHFVLRTKSQLWCHLVLNFSGTFVSSFTTCPWRKTEDVLCLSTSLRWRNAHLRKSQQLWQQPSRRCSSKSLIMMLRKTWKMQRRARVTSATARTLLRTKRKRDWLQLFECVVYCRVLKCRDGTTGKPKTFNFTPCLDQWYLLLFVYYISTVLLTVVG